MKRFQSSVQALLTLRQRAEQSALERYAHALLERQKALEKVEAVHAQQSAWWVRRREELDRGCSGGSLVQWSASDSRLREQRQKAEAALADAEVSVNQTLQQMLQTRRDRETAEKYLQRQRELFNRQIGREEQKALDELASRSRSAIPVLSWARPQFSES
jgi:flagellar export protein FliJ